MKEEKNKNDEIKRAIKQKNQKAKCEPLKREDLFIVSIEEIKEKTNNEATLMVENASDKKKDNKGRKKSKSKGKKK